MHAVKNVGDDQVVSCTFRPFRMSTRTRTSIGSRRRHVRGRVSDALGLSRTRTERAAETGRPRHRRHPDLQLEQRPRHSVRSRSAIRRTRSSSSATRAPTTPRPSSRRSATRASAGRTCRSTAAASRFRTTAAWSSRGEQSPTSATTTSGIPTTSGLVAALERGWGEVAGVPVSIGPPRQQRPHARARSTRRPIAPLREAVESPAAGATTGRSCRPRIRVLSTAGVSERPRAHPCADRLEVPSALRRDSYVDAPDDEQSVCGADPRGALLVERELGSGSGSAAPRAAAAGVARCPRLPPGWRVGSSERSAASPRSPPSHRG